MTKGGVVSWRWLEQGAYSVRSSRGNWPRENRPFRFRDRFTLGCLWFSRSRHFFWVHVWPLSLTITTEQGQEFSLWSWTVFFPNTYIFNKTNWPWLIFLSQSMQLPWAAELPEPCVSQLQRMLTWEGGVWQSFKKRKPRHSRDEKSMAFLMPLLFWGLIVPRSVWIPLPFPPQLHSWVYCFTSNLKKIKIKRTKQLQGEEKALWAGNELDSA